MTDVTLAYGAFDPAERLAALGATGGGAGAIVSFTGVARPSSAAGLAVERLYLDHHPRLTLQSMEHIAHDTLERFALVALSMTHRCGEIRAGEPIVFVGASALHRRAAFEAVDYAMDRLKTEALFWKREDGPEGSGWVEPAETDYAARARWEL